MIRNFEHQDELVVSERPPDMPHGPEEGKNFFLEDARQTVADLANEQNEALRGMFATATEHGLSDADVTQVLEERQVSDRFRNIRRRAEGLLRGLRKAVFLGMGTVVFSQFVDIRELPELLPKSAVELKEAGNQERVDEEYIRQSVLTGTKEQGLLRSELDRDGKFTKITTGTETSSVTDFADVEKLIKAGSRNIDMIHTHPAELYRNLGYTERQLAFIKSGEAESAPLPPSALDIQGAVSTRLHFKSDKVEFLQQVYEPSGIWEFKLDSKHPFVNRLKAMDEEGRKFSKGVKFSKLEIELLKKKVDANTDPREIIPLLESDPETKSIAKRFENFLEKIEEKYEKELKELNNLELLAYEVMASGSNEPLRQEATRKYLDLCKNIGIEMNYKPYSKKNQ